jgi:hypothetical protein
VRLGGRVQQLFWLSRGLVRIVYRDPEHVTERLMLTAVQRLGEPSLTWARATLAARPASDPGALASDFHRQAANVARIDGAIAGTPFLVALIPGYVGYLWQEAMIVLRTAALHGRDPREPRAAAELLVLRGVHPSVEAAQSALDVIRTTSLPDKPSERRSLRTWVRSVRAILVLGGFLSPRASGSSPRRHEKLLVVAGIAFGALTWVATWFFPVTLMALMAWGCERNARDLGRRALAFYGDGTQSGGRSERPQRGVRRVMRGVALFLSVALPIAFIAYADRVRQTTGVNAVGAAGALVAVSMVIAAAVVLNRR